MNTETHQKITATHLKRNAYLYVRQSTMRQVVENTESTQRQYALRQRAIALGWRQDQIIVIDSDLGQSGASAVDREGFQKLVGETGMGRAGIVLGLEVSRLARNSADWHRLLEICALTDTLILDEDGIYDPAHFNDRLLLGLKGTMSEAEIHVMRARLRGGLLNKARRGELRCRLPIGLLYDAAGHVMLDPDKQVQETVRLLFETFARTGSLNATVKSFRQQHLLFPTRVAAGAHKGELVWTPLSLGRACTALHNPWYAGAYAFGRSRFRTQTDGRQRHERLPREQWHFLIRDAHPAYISWQEYERNEQQLQHSSRTLGFERNAGPAREGSALLQGKAVCGLCGSRMNVHYNVRKDGMIPNYVCVGRGRLFGDPLWQSILGTGIDAAVGQLLVDAVTLMCSSSLLPCSRRLRPVSMRLITCAAARSSEPSTRPIAPVIVTCRWIPPIVWSPTLWRPTGTQNCVPSLKPRRTTSAGAPLIGSLSTSRSGSASWPSPPTSPPCGVIPKPRSANASACSRS